ncbi:M20 family metallopeptidase [Aeoliella mucimassa]|uniref:Putative succinyl-diaminopimelate desuccinylase n=1 Tax=Aeoliella mucimassa TaxID=2527972 RepID=A0A518ATD1_9BACT|nr:M20/M25/M40 family metallo-hydrolase [Aeoliella mucimassa]QDU57966.1 putative succinyl-diaminopimelate desuccinylase [Aeoliella mucimassa]
MPQPPQTCEELLARMIEFDTVVAYQSGREAPEKPLADYLAGLATEWGFRIRELPVDGAGPNLLIEHLVDEQAPWIMFDSHLDTVGTEGMSIPPFEPAIRDGRMYGRGACDTKGTGATMLWSLKQYAQSESQPNNIAVLLSVGEEHVQIGARAFVDQHLALLGWRPAAVVVGEPTRMNVLAATGGFIRWKMTTLGKACHSSQPDRGHNAIYDMARLITMLEDDYIAKIEATDPLVGRASAAGTVVSGGRQVNVIPSEATLTFDRRLVPGEIGETELTRVKELVAELIARRPGMQVDHHHFESAPPMAVVDGGAWSEAAVAALASVGITSKISGELFTTNGNHFAAAGIPTLVTGPGDIAQAHTVDEWIELEQIALGIKGYTALMQAEVPIRD